MTDATKEVRPQIRNIHIFQIMTYRMPLAALVSILHRISGALLFVTLPFVLFLLDKSLLSESTFEYFKSFTSGWFVKLIILALSWAFLHHFCAGIRHLVMDKHVWLTKPGHRRSAAGVLLISLTLAVLVGLKLFGVI
ncbi:MAG: succinate dehydrogenase, cytochrome b556 subunit [Herbaspirillum sp.]